tara:strand:- start:1653 stop:1928 length:276 start_codon:yes stop_codon:yes gene_type:complete
LWIPVTHKKKENGQMIRVRTPLKETTECLWKAIANRKEKDEEQRYDALKTIILIASKTDGSIQRKALDYLLNVEQIGVSFQEIKAAADKYK